MTTFNKLISMVFPKIQVMSQKSIVAKLYYVHLSAIKSVNVHGYTYLQVHENLSLLEIFYQEILHHCTEIFFKQTYVCIIQHDK